MSASNSIEAIRWVMIPFCRVIQTFSFSGSYEPGRMVERGCWTEEMRRVGCGLQEEGKGPPFSGFEG